MKQNNKKQETSKDLKGAKKNLEKAIKKKDSKEIVLSAIKVLMNDPNLMNKLTKRIFLLKDLLQLSLEDKRLVRSFVNGLILEEEQNERK